MVQRAARTLSSPKRTVAFGHVAGWHVCGPLSAESLSRSRMNGAVECMRLPTSSVIASNVTSHLFRLKFSAETRPGDGVMLDDQESSALTAASRPPVPCMTHGLQNGSGGMHFALRIRSRCGNVGDFVPVLVSCQEDNPHPPAQLMPETRGRDGDAGKCQGSTLNHHVRVFL